MISVLMKQFIQPVCRLVFGITSQFKRLATDKRAGALIYVTATLPVIVGTALLAVDGSRFYSLHTSLQKAADALAIAGAGELDRAPGAIGRANLAITNMVENDRIFSAGGNFNIDVDVVSGTTEIAVRFLETLPAKDSDPILAANLVSGTAAEQDIAARYVEVTINPSNFGTMFPASFLGGSNVAQSSAVAVAGNDSVVCDLMPLFICNPYEPDGNLNHHEKARLISETDTPAERSRMILLKAGPSTAGNAYFPGDFGFLDMGNGAPALANALAYDKPETCFLQNGVTTETGHKVGPVEVAINVRFGMYPNGGPLNQPGGFKPDENPGLRPSINVRKGQAQNVSKQCEDHTLYTGANPSQKPLPRDPCFQGTDPYPCDLGIADLNNADGRIGLGPDLDDMNDYWDDNYAGTGGMAFKPDFSVAANRNRYDVYRLEIQNDLYNITSPVVNGGGGSDESGEKGHSDQNSCWKGPALDKNDPIDRRLVNGAIINCQALTLNEGGFGPPGGGGGPPAGKIPNMPVVAFAEFFLTEPMSKDGTRSLWVEMVRILIPGNGGNGNSLDMVQLYR